MKVKRFFGADVREALRQVRHELGADAVILSNRAIENGVEVVAAIDYSEEAVAQAGERRTAVENDLAAKLRPDAVTLSGKRTAANDAAPAPRDTAAMSAAAAPRSEIIWSQDPVLVEMRRDINTLRGLMETHFLDLAAEEYHRRHPLKVDLLRRLMRLGLGATLCEQIVDSTNTADDIEHCWRTSLGTLAGRLMESDIDLINHGGLVALVGPTGVGKTTTLAKLAARFALRHGARQVALISADEFRIGAHEQIRIYGRILNIPVRTVSTAQELQTAIAEFSDRRLVLIDTAGIGQRNRSITGQLSVLDSEVRKLRKLLVLSATTHRTGLLEIIDAFRFLTPSACVLTKTDETTQLGGALDALVSTQLPVAFVCDGQRVPEDIHPARAHNLVSQCVAITQEIDEKYREETELSFGGVASNARNQH